MTFRDLGPLIICRLLVLFVVAVVGIYNVFELANFVLEMYGLDFGIVKVGS